MEENVQSVSNDIGTIKITDEVVAIIAGIAAMEVPGVTSMSGGIAGGIAEALGRKTCQKASRSKWEKRKPPSTFISSSSTATGYLKWHGRYRKE